MGKTLDEVSFIRPILIILLVFFHAFIIHAGGWETPIEGLEKLEVWRWADLLSYSCMLETFVFISGYLFYYQVVELKRKYSVWDVVKKKFPRLLLPCWVFGVIYVAAYGHDGGMLEIIRYIALGAGHLWFLPMLFWCFIIGVVTSKHVSFKMLPLWLVVAMLWVNPLPLRLNQAMYYFLFFYMGMLAFKYRDVIVRKLSLYPKSVVMFWLVFIILFVAGTLFNGMLGSYRSNFTQIIPRVLIQMAINMIHIIYSTMGLMCIYLTALTVIRNRKLHTGYVEFGKHCFTIYIFQQFILMYLYYHTSLLAFVGSFWLPVFGFVITLGGSYLLSRVSHSL